MLRGILSFVIVFLIAFAGPIYLVRAAGSIGATEDEIEEVVVLGARKGSYTEITEITENTQKLVEIPGSLGDPLAAITALPGVITPADGGEPAVRGSSPDDNRYYVDGMPAGYIFHEFNTSIFDGGLTDNSALYISIREGGVFQHSCRVHLPSFC